MNAPKFKIGQEVVCVKKDEWVKLYGKWPIVKPQYGEIYTISDYVFEFGLWWPSLKEFPPQYSFGENNFEPVTRIDDLKAILEQQPEEVTI